MAILIDFNQTVISSISVSAKAFGTDITESMIRHLVLNSIMATRKKFKQEYGEIVICADGPNNWRKVAFPYYKANRAKDKEKQSDIDWEFVYKCLDTLFMELDGIFPYKCVKVEGAEGDDIIGTLVEYFSENELEDHGLQELPQRTIIISSDGDFKQLQKYPFVAQYSPMQDKMIKEKNPNYHLFHKIIKGDRGDGVPNIRSAGDCFVMGVRQKPIKEVWIEEQFGKSPEEFDINEDIIDNFKRNQTMIDLSQTPENLKQAIITTYKKAEQHPRSGLLSYFIKYRLSNLQSDLQFF